MYMPCILELKTSKFKLRNIPPYFLPLLIFVIINERFHSRMLSFIKLETRKTREVKRYYTATETKGQKGSCLVCKFEF